MSSYILNTVRPANIQAWVAANAPGSLKRSAQESWKSYLQANSGTGKTLHDMETTFLVGQAATGSSLKEKWRSYLSGQTGGKSGEKAKNKYK